MNKLYLLVFFVFIFVGVPSSIREEKAIAMSEIMSLFEEKHDISTLLTNNSCCELNSSILSMQNNIVQQAGINMGVFKKLLKPITQGRFFKSIRSWFRNLFGIEEKKGAESLEQIIRGKSSKILRKDVNVKPIMSQAEELAKTFEDLRNNEDVSAKVSEYLDHSPRSYFNTVKTITCLRQDANEIRFVLREGNFTKSDKILQLGSETIKLAEYDIGNMREFTERGVDGVEYVYFKIPKYPQYVLDGKHKDRVFQSMIFGLPKDSSGNWKKFRAFLRDLFTQPMQLWDEWRFRQELAKFNISRRDVLEIEEYKFAKSEIKNEKNEFFEKKVA